MTYPFFVNRILKSVLTPIEWCSGFVHKSLAIILPSLMNEKFHVFTRGNAAVSFKSISSSKMTFNFCNHNFFFNYSIIFLAYIAYRVSHQKDVRTPDSDKTLYYKKKSDGAVSVHRAVGFNVKSYNLHKIFWFF